MEYEDVTDVDIKHVIQSMGNPCSHRDNISYLYNYFLKKSYTPRMPNTYGMYYWETLRDACDKIKDPPERSLLISADTYVLTQTLQRNTELINLFDANASYCPQMQQLAAAHQSAQSMAPFFGTTRPTLFVEENHSFNKSMNYMVQPD